MHMVKAAFIFAVIFADIFSRAHGWGLDGHAIVADIAFEHLSSDAKDGVTMILSEEGEGTTMGDVASWADHIRYNGELHWTQQLHFADIKDVSCGNPETGYSNCTFKYKRDCVDSNGHNLGFCIAGAITNFTKELQSGLESGDQYSNQTLHSLKFLIHFIGDVSQPLHCGLLQDVDGLRIKVDYPVTNHGSFDNLHSVWDSGMIINKEATAGSRKEGRKFLETEIKSFMDFEWKDEMKKWAEITDPNEWVQDSLDQATSKAYRFANGTQIPLRNEPVYIPQSYYDAYMCAGCVVELQLAKAAIRLSKLLNTINWRH